MDLPLRWRIVKDSAKLRDTFRSVRGPFTPVSRGYMERLPLTPAGKVLWAVLYDHFFWCHWSPFSLTRGQLVELAGISRAQVSRLLGQLEDKELLQRIGVGRRVFFRVFGPGIPNEFRREDGFEFDLRDQAHDEPDSSGTYSEKASRTQCTSSSSTPEGCFRPGGEDQFPTLSEHVSLEPEVEVGEAPSIQSENLYVLKGLDESEKEALSSNYGERAVCRAVIQLETQYKWTQAHCAPALLATCIRKGWAPSWEALGHRLLAKAKKAEARLRSEEKVMGLSRWDRRRLGQLQCVIDWVVSNPEYDFWGASILFDLSVVWLARWRPVPVGGVAA